MERRCFHCCDIIEPNKYLSMPIEHDISKDEYKFFGYFCSWECMKTYNLETKSSNKNIIFNNIEELYVKMNGKGIIEFAPFKEELKVFGGDLTIDEFKKKKTIKPNKKYVYPMVPEHVHIERHDNFTLNNTESANETFNNFELSSVQNEPIKLNRNVPRKTNQNTLEKTMGLFASN